MHKKSTLRMGGKSLSSFQYKNTLSTSYLLASATPISEPTARFYPAGGKAKELKTRINTIASIVKVTSSMKMIANAKLQKQQERLKVARTWRKASVSLLEHEYPPLDTKDEFYLDKKQAQETEEVEGQELIIAISSDRGLCGGVNSQIGKDVLRLIKIKPKASVMFIGEKPIQQLQREYSKSFIMAVSQVSGNKPITFHECAELADRILEMPFEKYTFVFNQFASVMSFNLSGIRYPSVAKFIADEGRHVPFVITDFTNILKSSFEFNIAGLLFSILTESQTCEIAARMSAMDSATTNGRDLIKTLTLQYNKQRQSAITTELVEIVSGASAVDEQRKRSEE